MSTSRFNSYVLGVMQDGGLPHMGCNKVCCTTARANGLELFPACLGIHDSQTNQRILIDATPSISPQVALLHKLAGVPLARPVFDALLLTHAHIGHYAGLLQLGKETSNCKAIPTFTSKRMRKFLTENAPWSQLVKDKNIDIHTFNSKQTNNSFSPIEGISIEAIPIPHREDFSDTVAFKITGSTKTILYMPDIDHHNDAPLLETLFDGVDVAYIDGTFYDETEIPNRNFSEIPHPFMTKSMEVLQPYADANPGMIRFIHLNHSNPALTDADIQTELQQNGFALALQGEQVVL